MKRVKSLIIAVLLIACSLGFALVLGEVALRLAGADRYYVFPPGLETLRRPVPGVLPGIEGEARFIVNESGMRGDPYPDDDRFKILAVGGSTTICSFLDQAEAWPQLVQEKLNAAGARVWVGNVGRSGHNSRHHMLHVEKLLEQQHIDLVLVLVGANDMSMRLKRDADYRRLEDEPPVYHEQLVYQSFSVFPVSASAGAFYYKNTEIYRLLRQLRRQYSYRPGAAQIEDILGEAYQKRREHRANAGRILTELPDLAAALGEYESNLKRIADLAQARGARVVFMTQPYIWRTDLPPSLERLLWLGGVGDFQNVSGQPYYSVDALARAMNRYNRSLLQVCAERGLDCLDLAALVPQDESAFSDDIHFNEPGARTVADAVAGFLLERRLLD